jgi:hypothetical protein
VVCIGCFWWWGFYEAGGGSGTESRGHGKMVSFQSRG